MYALKLITVRNGRQVEEVHVLGNMYRLEMLKDHADLAARVEHVNEKGDTPNFDIVKSDEAYITTLTGETIRHICRGDREIRESLCNLGGGDGQPAPNSSLRLPRLK